MGYISHVNPIAARLFNLLLCALLLGLSSPAAKAITRAENRVGGSPTFSPNFTFTDSTNPVAASGVNPGCGYDFASGVHKYLYAEANPVNGVDPSGHDDLISLSISMSIGSSLDAMYNGAVLAAGNAMQTTLIGVQNNETESAILGNYFEGVAIGVGIGVAVGMVADIAGDLVFGGEVDGETVGVEVNDPTTSGAQGFAATESTTTDLMGAAARAAKTVEDETGLKEGMSGFGTKAHTEFAKDVKAMGLNSEVSYYKGEIKPYGYPGSVRLDVVKGDVKAPQAIWDLKTGSAKLTPERIQQIRDNLPPACRDIPVIEIRP